MWVAERVRFAGTASGVAVIALPVDVLTDAVVNDASGLVLSPAHPDARAAALKSVLSQRFRFKSMGAAGRSRALSRFSWDRIALDSLNSYRQVAEERSLRLPSRAR